MFAKYLCATAMAASVAFVPARQAQSDEAAAFLGGALIGGLVVNEVHKSKQRKQQQSSRSTYSSSGVSSAQRQQNREVQTALNYFGYNVGTVDGQLGRRSRAGISQYQADMGYNIDGYLDDYERNFLLTSYNRALSSAHVAPYNQIVASQGTAGLLRSYRNEQLGIATPQTATQPQLATAPQTQAPQPITAPVLGGETVAARADTGGQLPSFGFAPAGKSANELCNDTSLLTASNGGATQPGGVSNVDLALNEQFCQARINAIADASKLEENIPNMTAPQIEAQCQQLTDAIAPKITGIDTQTPDQVVANTSAVLTQSGNSIDQLVSGGKVCLGVGYRTDDAEMALSSAVLLVAAGQKGYAEIVSHQLREGIGVAKATGAQPQEWMQMALSAAESGSPVLGQTPQRLAVLSEATGGGGATSSTLPIFSTTTSD